MMKALPLSLLLLSGTTLANEAAMPDQAILACRTMHEGGARLACYDAIQLGGAPRVVTATAIPQAEKNFGIEARKQREQEPQSITSTIPGNFEGWGPGAQIRLANGQVWRIVDGSEAVLPRMRDPRVTIERNAFGTLFLKVEGTNNSAKVRRVQ